MIERYDLEDLEFELPENELKQYRAEIKQWLCELRPKFRKFLELLQEYEECSRMYIYKVRCKYCGRVITIRTSLFGGIPDSCPNCGQSTKIHYPTDTAVDRDTWDTMFAPSPWHEYWYEKVSEEIADRPEDENRRKEIAEKIEQLISEMHDICRKYGIDIWSDEFGLIKIINIKEGKLGRIKINGSSVNGWIWSEIPMTPLDIIIYADGYKAGSDRQNLIEMLEEVLMK